jgi:hypothetical protein
VGAGPVPSQLKPQINLNVSGCALQGWARDKTQQDVVGVEWGVAGRGGAVLPQPFLWAACTLPYMAHRGECLLQSPDFFLTAAGPPGALRAARSLLGSDYIAVLGGPPRSGRPGLKCLSALPLWPLTHDGGEGGG